MTELRILPSCFDLERRLDRGVVEVRRPSELVERGVLPDRRWRWIADGAAVGEDDELPAGTRELVAVGVPEGPAIPIIVSAVVSAVVSIGIAYLVNLLFGGGPEAESNSGESPTYGWSGIRNTRTQGSPIAKVYGRHRVAGQIIASYRRAPSEGSTDQNLYMLIALGSGPVQSINGYVTDQNDLRTDDGDDVGEGLRINGLPASTYQGVRVWYRMGTDSQTNLTDPLREVVQPVQVDDPITLAVADSDWQTYQARGSATGAYLNLRFPRGLFDQRGGGIGDFSVVLEVEYRFGSGSWSTVPGSPFTYTGATVSAFNRTIFAEDLGGPGALQIRYRRQDAEVNDQLVADQVELQTVGEITGEDAGNYPGIAMVGLIITATDRLNTGIPQVSSDVQGVAVPAIAQGKSGDLTRPAINLEHSRNPAWIALDILLDRKSGLGNYVTIDDIDVESFLDWAQWCAEVVTYREAELEPLFETTETEAVEALASSIVLTADEAEFPVDTFIQIENEPINRVLTVTSLGGGRTELELVRPVRKAYPTNFLLKKLDVTRTVTQPRARCDYVFDSDGSAWDALQAVMRTGRAVPVKLGNRIGVRYEHVRTPVQHVADTNMIEDSFEVQYVGRSERVDVVEVQFLDAQQDYDQSVEVAGAELEVLDKAPIRKTFQAYGITDRSHARREAHYQLQQKKNVWKRCRFRLPQDGLAFMPGDVFTVGSTLPAWSSVVTRASGTLDSLTLDHPVTLASGTTYKLLVVVAGSPAGIEVEITSAAGTYAAGGTITTDGDPIALDQAPATLGELGTVSTEWRAVDVSIADDLTVEVEAVQYVPAIYELPGWGLGDPEPAPPSGGGCVDAGSDYFQSWTGLLSGCLPCAYSCPTGRTCVVSSIDIDVVFTGTGSDCITINEISEIGISFSVSEDCTSSATLDLEVDATVQFVCCPDNCLDPDQCLCSPGGPECTANQTYSWTVC